MATKKIKKYFKNILTKCQYVVKLNQLTKRQYLKRGENDLMNGLDAVREVYGLSLEDLAKMLDITRQSIHDWGKPNRKIPKKRLEQLSDLLKIPIQYFLINDISQKEILEIRKYKLNKELEETMFNYEDEVQDEKGNWITIPSIYMDPGLMEHIDFNDMELKVEDLFTKIKGVINDYKPAFGKEEFTNVHDIINHMDTRVSLYNRFTDIIESNNQVEMLYQIMRAMELFFNVNVKKNQLWGEQPTFQTDLVKDEAKLVKTLVGVLQEYYKEVEDKKKELIEDSKWLNDNFPELSEDSD